MIVDFLLPDLGEGMEEAEVVSWLVAEGDSVARDQPFVELQTDKAVVEIPSPVEGTVVGLGAPVGAMVAVGQVLISFESTDGDGRRETALRPSSAPVTTAPPPAPPPASPPQPGAPAHRPKASPSVRRRARELGVDLASIAGSGEGGRVVASDVEQAAAALSDDESTSVDSGLPPLSAPVPAAGRRTPPGDVRMPLRGIRRATARVMTDAWSTIPHITGMDEIDATELLTAQAAVRAADDAPVTLLSFFVKAVCLGLRRHPMLNARIDMANEEIVQLGERNIGFAAATPAGLVVPVIRNADHQTLRELGEEIARLTGLARSGRLAVDDLRGGTFTITNFGALGGGRFATPIIRPPEVAIMGFGAIKERPFVVDGSLEARPTLPYSISVDHRLIDGELSGSFSRYVTGLLASPTTMLLDA